MIPSTADSLGKDRPAQPRPVWRSLGLGFFGRCPQCGAGPLYASYLEVAKTCSHCGEEFYHHRADHAPPYFSLFLVAHVVVPLAVIVEHFWHPPLVLHASLWVPLALLLTLVTLPRIKGAIVALQWALRMHGFEYAALAGPRRHHQGNPVEAA